MSIATMTSRGRITIPKDVRHALGLTPGDSVSFSQNQAGEFVISRATASAADLAGALSYVCPAKSFDDMERAIVEAATGQRSSLT